MTKAERALLLAVADIIAAHPGIFAGAGDIKPLADKVRSEKTREDAFRSVDAEATR